MAQLSWGKPAIEFEVRAAKGREKPIVDEDGVVKGEYAFR